MSHPVEISHCTASKWDLSIDTLYISMVSIVWPVLIVDDQSQKSKKKKKKKKKNNNKYYKELRKQRLPIYTYGTPTREDF